MTVCNTFGPRLAAPGKPEVYKGELFVVQTVAHAAKPLIARPKLYLAVCTPECGTCEGAAAAIKRRLGDGELVPKRF